MELDITAPIIPYEGFGEIKLYSSREELYDVLALCNEESITLYEQWIRYDIQNSIALYFHLTNDNGF